MDCYSNPYLQVLKFASTMFQEIGSKMTELFQLADKLKDLHTLLGDNDSTVAQLETHVRFCLYILGETDKVGI